MSGVPSVLYVGAVQLSVADPAVGAAATAMAKALSEADAPLLSVTLITMLEVVPAAVGVPVSAPVTVLKLAQLGLLTMVKPKVSPLAS